MKSARSEIHKFILDEPSITKSPYRREPVIPSGENEIIDSKYGSKYQPPPPESKKSIPYI